MLERSLFEDMVDAHWVTVEPDNAVKRMDQHWEHTGILYDEAARAFPEYLDPADLPVVDQSHRAKLSQHFGRYGEKSWTDLSLYRRVQLVEHLWGDEQARRQLQFFRSIVNRSNNQQLHASSHALSQLVRENTEGRIGFYSGPSAERMENGAVRLVLDHDSDTRPDPRPLRLPDETRKRLETIFIAGHEAFQRPAQAPG
jgi:hypothetical protein